MIDRGVAAGREQPQGIACRDALALLAHDLRSSIMVIHGFAVTLSGGHPHVPQVQRDFALSAIARHAEGLLAFSHDILDIVDAEDGVLQLSHEPVDLGDVAVEVTQRVAPDYPGHRVGLDVEPVHRLARGDRRRIAQVLENFIRNAGRYSPPGTQIDVAVRRGPDFVAVTVFDTGPPLPADVAEHPFGKVGARQDRGGGAGLGLYLCRLVVESLGGRVWSESDAGGVTFGFLLPVVG